MIQELFTEYFFYHLINYLLSVITWTLIGRFVLFLIIGDNRANYIYNFFCLLTDWYLRRLTVITPAFLPYSLLPIYGLFFFILLRLLFWIIAYNMGWSPRNVV